MSSNVSFQSAVMVCGGQQSAPLVSPKHEHGTDLFGSLLSNFHVESPHATRKNKNGGQTCTTFSSNFFRLPHDDCLSSSTTHQKVHTYIMAIGPFARVLAQVVVPIIAVVARALPAAYAQALNNARRNGTAATATALRRNALSTTEAADILNVKHETMTAQEIDAQYEKYMAANAVTKEGGSFYLQSKVYRARELLKEYQEEKKNEEAGAEK